MFVLHVLGLHSRRDVLKSVQNSKVHRYSHSVSLSKFYSRSLFLSESHFASQTLHSPFQKKHNITHNPHIHSQYARTDSAPIPSR